MRVTRMTSLSAVMLVGALALAGCSQGSATKSSTAGGQVTVRFMDFSANGGHEQDLSALVTAFEAQNKDVKIQVETVPYDSYFTKLQTAVAGGTAADTFELDYQNFVSYAKNGSLAPLAGVDGTAYKDSLLKAFVSDGKQYGLPESFSNVVLFYNKTLFDKAGVAAPTASWTWADEQAAAAKLTDATAKVWGDYQPISYNEYYKSVAQAGGQFLSADGKSAAFDSPTGIAAAKWLVDKAGKTMPTDKDGAGTPDFDTNLFKAGKLAMWHTGIWMFSAMKDAPFNWDVVVEPGDTAKASAMFANGVAVNSASKNKAAAQKWLTFLSSSDDMVTARLKTSWELPPVADTSKLSSYLSAGKPANRQAVFDSLNATVLPPVVERQQEMQDAVTKKLTEAAAGRMTAEAAVKAAATAVNALLK